MNIFKRCYRNVVLFFGEVRKINAFPWFTWSHHNHKIDYSELTEMMSVIKYGDIGLHRDAGFLSNLFIPSSMKHAWIHVEDGETNPTIVEAIGKGVMKRSSYYPLFSDYAVVLSPKGVTDEERKGACVKAKGIVGQEYDVDFKFDIEKELKFYRGDDIAGAKEDLEVSQRYLRKHKYAFSCTETVAYAWWHKRELLNIFRTKHMGKESIIPDDYLNNAWELKWVSKSLTVEVAEKLGMKEEGVLMIKNYWESKQQAPAVEENDNSNDITQTA